MLDNLLKSDKINIADRVCYEHQTKTQCGEFGKEEPAFWHTLSALIGSPFFIGRLNMTMTKECSKKYKDKLKKETPWLLTLIGIKSRCQDKNTRYYRKGIKNFLTVEDLKYLWFRDKADLLKQPSIDRINNDGHYTLENCRYIEFLENARMGGKLSNRLKRSQPTAKMDLNRKIICLYPSIREAARQNNLSRKNISFACIGKDKIYNGFKWKYLPKVPTQ